MGLPKVLATHLLKHRIKHKGKNGDNRVYIIFWVNFKTGEIDTSVTHSNLTCDKFLCYETNKHYEEYTII